MIDPRCILSTLTGALRGWLFGHARITGHNMHESERWTNCNVNVIRCRWCGQPEVQWTKTARSRYWPYPDERLTEEEVARREREQESAAPEDDVITRVTR